MSLSEFHKKIAKEDKYRLYVKMPILTFSSWLFQGILYMDTTEKVFKILLDILFFIPIYFIFRGYGSLSLFIAIIFTHTINWIFNGQIFVLLKNLRLTKTEPERFIQYLNDLQKRIKKENSILAAAAFGSLSRGQLKETSDLDIRIIRKKGVINGFRACLFVLSERTRALFNKFPLDIYVLDDVTTIKRHIDKVEIKKLIMLYDPYKILEGVFK